MTENEKAILSNAKLHYQTCVEHSHDFIVVNWTCTEKSRNASRLLCRRCLLSVNMDTVNKVQEVLSTVTI